MRSLLRLPLLLGITFSVFAPSALAACPGEGAAIQVSRENQTAPPAASVTLAPGSSVTYNYQVEELVSTTRDNFVDEGRYVWQSRMVDEGSYVWQSKMVDRGSYVWESRWVDEGYMVYQGYWEGALETTNQLVWVTSSHTAYNKHYNKYIIGGKVTPLVCSIPHTHDSVEGDCGGHGGGFITHWNLSYTHTVGSYQYLPVTSWNPYVRWVDTSYWQAVLVDRGSLVWQSRMVDEGSYVWQSRMVDRGSNVWVPNIVNRPITTSEWVTRTAVTGASSLPTSSATLRFVGSTTYNWVEVVQGCSSPT